MRAATLATTVHDDDGVVRGQRADLVAQSSELPRLPCNRSTGEPLPVLA